MLEEYRVPLLDNAQPVEPEVQSTSWSVRESELAPAVNQAAPMMAQISGGMSIDKMLREKAASGRRALPDDGEPHETRALRFPEMGASSDSDPGAKLEVFELEQWSAVERRFGSEFLMPRMLRYMDWDGRSYASLEDVQCPRHLRWKKAWKADEELGSKYPGGWFFVNNVVDVKSDFVGGRTSGKKKAIRARRWSRRVEAAGYAPSSATAWLPAAWGRALHSGSVTFHDAAGEAQELQFADLHWGGCLPCTARSERGNGVDLSCCYLALAFREELGYGVLLLFLGPANLQVHQAT